ncbi:MAG TPA: MFS transporter [Candidatus Limnocylindria bacterium]|nr:MFS transporter [Candidatus Limnocylindria bacterium]
MTTVSAAPAASRTVFSLLFAVGFSHMLNDIIQALLPAIYPVLKSSYGLTFTQLGLITFAFQVTASIFQPVVGFVTDRRTIPHTLSIGMSLTLLGLLSLAFAPSYHVILLSAGLIGLGSSIFHPEASRVAHMAAGERRGLAQSIFQTGGNAGTSLGPLLAASVVVPHGQHYIAWFSIVALIGVAVLWNVGQWQRKNQHHARQSQSRTETGVPVLSRKKVFVSLAILVALIFSKYIYLASLTNYYTFYLMDRFKLSIQNAQYYLFLFLGAVALGTIIGGPIGDRIGRKRVIWVSILGVAPFSVVLPHVGLFATAALSMVIGFILASAFSAILVYAQELMPGRVGMIAGLFFGLAFGIAGIGSAILGKLADHQGINFVFQVCAFLPLIGLLTIFLPNIEKPKRMLA